MVFTLLTGSLVGSGAAILWKKARKKSRKIAVALKHKPSASPTELEAKKQQYVAAGALATTGVGALTHSALSVIGLPLVAYNLYYLVRGYIASYKKKNNLATLLFESISIVATLIFGAFWLLSALMLLLFSTQRLIARTEHDAQTDFSNIFGSLADTAWVLKEGVELEVPLAQVEKNDTIVLQAGDMIPVDGLVIAGEGLVDQCLMTGESQPSEKTLGDKVLTSTLLISGGLHVKVSQCGGETVAGQIAKTLEHAATFKNQAQSRAESIVDKGASFSLLASAVALPFMPLSHSMALTYSGFGYQMRMAAPLLVLNYLRIASRMGILVKDGRVFDKLRAIDTVVFDKTGTLTETLPHVGQIKACNGFSHEQVLQYAASIEQRQQHPIALAIHDFAKEQHIKLLNIQYSDYQIGHGLRAELHDPKASNTTQHLLLGSLRFMQAQAIEIPSDIQTMQDEAGSKGHIVVYLASVEKGLLGAIELHPTIRPEAREVVKALQTLGVSIYIISGDQEEPTRHLAQTLGIDHYFAQTLPNEKAKHIESLQAQGRKVCFVGDGINDSVALQRADVSISLHGAATIAQDAAEILLMTPDLLHLPRLISMAQELDKSMSRGELMNNCSGIACVGSVFFLGMGLSGAILLYAGGFAISTGNALLPLFKHHHSLTTSQKPKEL